MNLSLSQQVIEDPDGKIKYKVFHLGGRRHYHVGVWLDGPEEELDGVERVDYLLHPTFQSPARSSADRSNNFSITFWTWGTFPIVATVRYSNGVTQKTTHLLTLEMPADDGTNYVQLQTSGS